MVSDREASVLVITDVQTQRRRAERRSIFINGEFAFGLSEETYAKYAVFKGREVTTAFLEEVRNAECHYQARQIALRFVGRRMRTRREIESKLAEREFPGEVIDATLEFLRGYGIMDDERFASAFVNDQLLRRPVGRRRLEQELQRKGLDREVARGAVARLIDADEEFGNAMSAATKRLANLRETDPVKRDRTLSTFLSSRGFGWDTIGRVLREIRSD